LSNWNETVTTHGLTQLIKSATRVTDKTTTIIDHLYTSNVEKISDVFVSKLNISDHFPICFTRTANSKNAKKGHKTITYRSFNSFDETSFFTDLAKSNIHQIETISDPNQALSLFYEMLNNILNKYAPLKEKRIKHYHQPEWFNSDVKEAIRRRNKINKKENFTEYKIMRNKVTSVIRKAKKDFYNAAVRDNKDTKYIWKNLRELSNDTSTNISLPERLNNIDANDQITDIQEIANALNEHFINVSHIVQKSSFNKNNFDSLRTFLDNKLIGKTFHINFITILEVKRYIKELDTSKASGVDGIGPRILKLCGDSIVLPITSIINNSIVSGVFPDLLKEAYVIPIYKSLERNDPNNYRPISILPTVSKIFEKHIATQLRSFFLQTEILHKFQSGFRQNHSCLTSLVRLIDDFLEAIDQGKAVGALFLDLRKAFDLVDHEILLYKLKLYHFDEGAQNLFSSYLSNRKQFVKVGNIKSSKSIIKCGVPQGSILGPLLFIIYINDIGLHLQNSSLDLYADDSTLYAFGDTSQEIENKLQINSSIITDWCSKNNMSLHPNKTKCMLLGSQQKLKHMKELDVYINDVKIENVPVKKVLGVYIDRTLSWDIQVNKICSKINSKLSLLKRISYFLTFDMKCLFYNSYIVSAFDYCCPVWAKHKQIHTKKIFTLQKRVGKVILQKPMRTPSNVIFDDLKWLTFENRVNYHICILVYKTLHNQCPVYMKDIISFSRNENYSLRSSSRNDIASFKYNTQYMKRSFANQSRLFWNTLPENIRSASSIKSFKTKCKQYLLQNQTV
jgi:hypothetical protein